MDAPLNEHGTTAAPQSPDPAGELASEINRRAPREAAELLAGRPHAEIIRVLQQINPLLAEQVLDQFSEELRSAVLSLAPEDRRRQWSRNLQYPEDSVGRLMSPARAVFRPDTTVREAVEELREIVKRAFITYAYVTDERNRLVGVIAMRELLLAGREDKLEQIMLRQPFCLTPNLSLVEAMRSAVSRHYPAYPVCDADGHLLGIVRGQHMFEAQAIEISAQAGSMVGVEKEERLSTPWPRSLRFRHGWLQFNLLTAFAAAGVVSMFQQTIDRLVILAAFLPVLAGQSGNTGCQALAVTLRALTLGELKPGQERRAVIKEAVLGLLNGVFVGLTAAVGMLVFALLQGHQAAIKLAAVVFLAMIGSCVVSGISGATVPLVLKRIGADPATASSIFLTTATDVVSMGMLLGLATLMVR